ncbi:MAG TPA: NRDE family protein [Thermoplasmata archaeon]|nr:NRDE family protein [Thermoplasmata archaeon]
MCTLIALYRTVPGYDIVLGMNRDEDRTRPAEPPQSLGGSPAIVAPRDARAGGTWIGVNEAGLVAALSNRRGKVSTTARSRGQLMLDLLKLPKVRAAEIAVQRAVSEQEYNFFNLMVATREEMRFLTYDGQVRMSRGHEGLDVLTNAGGNAEGDEKLALIRSLAGPATFPDVAVATRWLEATLRTHGGPGTTALCNHGAAGGTVSSAILALHNSAPEEGVLLYADGSPCQVPYRDYSRLVQALRPASV